MILTILLLVYAIACYLGYLFIVKHEQTAVRAFKELNKPNKIIIILALPILIPLYFIIYLFV